MKRFSIGDAIVTDTGEPGEVVDHEVITDTQFYTVKLTSHAHGTFIFNENRLSKPFSLAKCECGAEAVFGKDTVLHSATMPCPKYRGRL